MGAASRTDAALASKYAEDVRMKNLVEADKVCLETLGSVQHFKQVRRKRKASGRKCCSYKRSGNDYSQCPSRLGLVSKPQKAPEFVQGSHAPH